ncbi:MAG TPA: hypothetical protein VJ144_09065 [Candidatus Polarisedimenticolia bacterium]|nr:hypothetical protein [Candidatus Polarisedimenticolia bacterium]
MPSGPLRRSIWCVALALLLAGCAGFPAVVAPPKPAAEKVAPVAPPRPPEASPEAAERLSRETRARLDATEGLLRPLDGKVVPAEQAERYSTVQSLLAKAKDALQRRDLQGAAALAEKAHLLASELAAALLACCAELPAAVAPPVAPVLSPDVSPEAAERLSRETRARLDATEGLLRPLDGKALPPEQAETYSTIQSFLAKAREALERQDLQRAATLADKANILAQELVQPRR